MFTLIEIIFRKIINRSTCFSWNFVNLPSKVKTNLKQATMSHPNHTCSNLPVNRIEATVGYTKFVYRVLGTTVSHFAQNKTPNHVAHIHRRIINGITLTIVYRCHRCWWRYRRRPQWWRRWRRPAQRLRICSRISRPSTRSNLVAERKRTRQRW